MDFSDRPPSAGESPILFLTALHRDEYESARVRHVFLSTRFASLRETIMILQNFPRAKTSRMKKGARKRRVFACQEFVLHSYWLDYR